MANTTLVLYGHILCPAFASSFSSFPTPHSFNIELLAKVWHGYKLLNAHIFNLISPEWIYKICPQ